MKKIKKKNLTKALAVFLSLVMMVTGAPFNLLSASAKSPDDGIISVVKELEQYRTEYSKSFLKSNGEIEAVISSNPIHFKENSKWEEIDPTLSLVKKNGKDVYQNAKGPFTVELPSQMEPNSAVKITKGDNTISINLLGAQKTSANKNGKKAAKSTKEQRKKMLGTELMQEDLTQSDGVGYSNIYTDTNVQYDVNSNGIKESVVLNKAPEKSVSYQYSITANGLEAVLNKDNSINFYKKGNQNSVFFHIPASFMFDGKDEYCYTIKTELTKKNGSFLLTYTPDFNWLKDSARVFPVVLDPSVTVNTAIQDSYTYSATSYQNTFLGYEQQLKVGKTTWKGPNDYWDAYIRFTQLPTIPQGYAVDSALMMLKPRSTEGTWSDLQVGAYEITGEWATNLYGSSSTGYITYNNRPASQSAPSATANINRNSTTNPVGFELASLVSKWYKTPSSNWGVRLSLTSQPANPNDAIVFNSSRSVDKPYLTITYSPYVPALSAGVTNPPENSTLRVGDVYKLDGYVTPSNATNQQVYYYNTNPSVATVDTDGTITALTTGTTQIYYAAADNEEITPPSIYLTVLPAIVHVESIYFAHPLPNDTMAINETWNLSAGVMPSDATNPNLIWESSDPSVANVDQYGEITSYNSGTTVIKATSAENSAIYASYTLTVYVPVEEIFIVTGIENNTMSINQSASVSAVFMPDNSTNKNVIWSSSNPSVASVNQYGDITANSVGTTVIKATSAENSAIYDTYTLTVGYPYVPVEGVAIVYVAPETRTLAVGQTCYIDAMAYPSNATNTNLNWTSSNTNVATVDQNGNVLAKSSGTVTIKAISEADPTKSNSVTFTVNGYTMTITGAPTTMFIGDEAEGVDVSIVPYSNTNVEWFSTDDSIAEVQSDILGVRIIAHAAGTATIYAQASGINAQATITITVGARPVENIQFYKQGESTPSTAATIYRGQTLRLAAKVVPANATYDGITFGSDVLASLEKVSSNAVVVTPLLDGPSCVYATAADFTSYFDLTIKNPTVNITGMPTLAMDPGQTHQLYKTVEPTNPDEITWRSSNVNVATISNTGNITAIANGYTQITVTARVGDYTTTNTISVMVKVGTIVYHQTMWSDNNSNGTCDTGDHDFSVFVNQSVINDSYVIGDTVYATTTGTKQSVIEAIRKASLYTIYTHGSQTGISTVDLSGSQYSFDSVTSDDINALPSGYFNTTQCVLLNACSTAQGGESAPNNLVNTIHRKGAMAVVGFQNTTYYSGGDVGNSLWARVFVHSLSENKTVYGAIGDALNATWDSDNGFWGTDSFYVAGNENLVIN